MRVLVECGCVVIMENINFGAFFLEDDDCNELFITQTPKESLVEHLDYSQKERNYSVFGDSYDFKSPCKSLVSEVRNEGAVYEDISDDKFERMDTTDFNNLG